MTEPSSSPTAAGTGRRSRARTPTGRRGHPAAASRILVTGLSAAATLGLASAMASPAAVPSPPSTTPPTPTMATITDRGVPIPAGPASVATDRTAITTSHAS